MKHQTDVMYWQLTAYCNCFLSYVIFSWTLLNSELCLLSGAGSHSLGRILKTLQFQCFKCIFPNVSPQHYYKILTKVLTCVIFTTIFFTFYFWNGRAKIPSAFIPQTATIDWLLIKGLHILCHHYYKRRQYANTVFENNNTLHSLHPQEFSLLAMGV